jgi:hypothetical protein
LEGGALRTFEEETDLLVDMTRARVEVVDGELDSVDAPRLDAQSKTSLPASEVIPAIAPFRAEEDS